MRFLRKIKKTIFLVLKQPKGFYDYLLDLFSALTLQEKALGKPVHIAIEPTNICNLRCSVCETGAGILRRPEGKMNLADFKVILDKIYRHTNSLLFYYMGEPFMNDDSYGMIKYAKEKGVYVTTCTNGHFIEAEKLIDSGLDEISFQLGGAREDSHNIYRSGGSLSVIIKNIKALVGLKKRLKAVNPKVILGFIIMKHNESELNDFYALAKELDADETRVIKPCVRNLEQAMQLLPSEDKYWIYDKNAFKKGILKPKHIPRNRCRWIYFSTVILYNGDIVPCCRDAHGEHIMGNILKEDFNSIWNGKKYLRFRRAIRKNQSAMTLCGLCSDFGIPDLYISHK